MSTVDQICAIDARSSAATLSHTLSDAQAVFKTQSVYNTYMLVALRVPLFPHLAVPKSPET